MLQIKQHAAYHVMSKSRLLNTDGTRWEWHPTYQVSQCPQFILDRTLGIWLNIQRRQETRQLNKSKGVEEAALVA